MREYPVNRSFDVVTGGLQRLRRLFFRESHGRDHGYRLWVSGERRRALRARRNERVREVGVRYVLHDPVRRWLDSGVLREEDRSFTRFRRKT